MSEESEDSGEGQGDDSGLSELLGSTSSRSSRLSLSDSLISRVAEQAEDSVAFASHISGSSKSSSLSSVCSLLHSAKGKTGRGQVPSPGSEHHPLFSGKGKKQSSPNQSLPKFVLQLELNV